MVEDPSGNQAMISPGGAFEIGLESDAWVFGNEPCVALDFASSAGGQWVGSYNDGRCHFKIVGIVRQNATKVITVPGINPVSRKMLSEVIFKHDHFSLNKKYKLPDLRF